MGDLTSDWEEGPYSPGHYVYHAISDPDIPIIVNMGWCTTTQEILDDNWSKMQYALSIDGVSIDLDTQMAFWSWTLPDSGPCYSYDGYTTGWSVGEHHIIWTHTITQALNDGWMDYEAGNYVMETILTIRGTPESGNNSVHQTPSDPTASPGEVISGPVEALSNIRMVAELDPDGIAQSMFPHDSPIAIAFDFDGSLVDETDEYTLTVVDSSGAPISQIPLYGPDNLIYGGTQFIIGAGYIRHFAVPILSEDEKFNPGEYRSDIALNEKTIASISWAVEP